MTKIFSNPGGRVPVQKEMTERNLRRLDKKYNSKNKERSATIQNSSSTKK